MEQTAKRAADADAAAELEPPGKRAKHEDVIEGENTADQSLEADAATATLVEAAEAAPSLAVDVTAAETAAEAAPNGVTVQQAEPAVAASDAAPHDAQPTTPSKAAAAAGTPATPAKSPGPQQKARLGDVVYRVLVPARSVGIVIGKGGCNVRELQSSSGARIQVGLAHIG
jgi:hypothetical protein